MEFSEACSEVDYILEHLNPNDKKKIPETLITLFRENKALFYQVNIDVNQPLEEQELKDETKAFLQVLGYKYFANEEQKEEFKEIFKKDNETSDLSVKSEILGANNAQTELVIYKENKILRWFKNILSFFKR